MRSRTLILLTGLLCGGVAHGQVDIANNPDNTSFGGGGPNLPDATSGQFAGVAGVSSSAARNTNPQISSNILEVLSSDGTGLVLQQSFLGGSFSGSIPDYFIGSVIAPPDPVMVDVGGIPTEMIFRAEPILWKTELVDHDNDPATPLVRRPVHPPEPAEGFQFVTEGAVDDAPGAFAFPAGYREEFYWSKHAGQVFATDAGRVTVHWRSVNRVREVGGANVYLVRSESYTISAGAVKPPRTIFWTESRFKGPWVQVPGGAVQEVVVAYNRQVPETVSEEEIYVPEGGSGTGEGTEVPLPSRTLWYDFNQGILRAYNKEGRVLVEYLGQQKAGNSDPTEREHLGFEVVDVIREIPPTQLTVHLGDRLLPSDGRASFGGEKASPDLEPKRLFPAGDFTASQVGTVAALGEGFVNTHQIGNQSALYGARRNDFADQVLVYWLEPSPEGDLGIEWPRYYNSYQIEWPREIDGFYALNARPADASLVAPSAWPVPPETTPQLVYQDDPDEVEATLNLSSELEIDFIPQSDDVNRSLLLLTSGNDFWYVRVYSYLEENLDAFRNQERIVFADALQAAESALSGDPGNPNLIAAVDAAERQLFHYDNFLNYHVDEVVAVGERILPPPGADSVAGYITMGDAYNPGAYISPRATSVPEAEAGAIIPVNARPDHDEFVVWWYEKIAPPTDAFEPLYFPSYVGRYRVVWPGDDGTAEVSEIILAENEGSGDLPPEQVAGQLYRQNDPGLPGYNPNEEHAIKFESRYYALRDDLAVTAGPDLVSSLPYVLVDYTAVEDSRPAMRVFRVLREKDVNGDGDLEDPQDIVFRYPAIAGTPLQPPLPLSVMPIPLLADETSANEEVTPSDLDPALAIPGAGLPAGDPANGQADLTHYNRFTYEDRKGLKWIYRGPHDPEAGVFADGDLGNDPAIEMQFYYNTIASFDYPDTGGVNDPPAVGTIVPYLRPYQDPADPGSGFGANDPKSVGGTPLTVQYVPFWPDDARLPDPPTIPIADDTTLYKTGVPELRYAETLTLPKFGLPQVRGNTSLNILYEQSIAAGVADQMRSAILYDPTRRKVFPLGGTLPTLPASIATSSSRGRTYFQLLPPHLQQRFFVDPLVGEEGALVLEGEFVEEIAGEDYLLPNVLSSDDVDLLKNLTLPEDLRKAAWDAAIDSLSTTLETFREDPNVPGTYIVSAPLNRPRAGSELAEVVDSDTAVDSYALAAVGGGEGYVTLIAQNGEAFTPEEEPVAVHILKVGGLPAFDNLPVAKNRLLYQGELKGLEPSNPLSEKVSLVFTGDFAGAAPEYEFEWLYTPPTGGGTPALPGQPGAPTWFPLSPPQAGLSRNVFGGGTQPLLTLGDNYLTMRYRPLDPDHAGYVGDGSEDAHWSGYTDPKLVEGWIKRVLAGINPFNQRLSDFFNNAIDTDISLLTQAGTRWEGDIALTLDNIDDVGLLEIYETVLNRGKSFSIEGTPAADYGPANDALLLAAGYIADLYQIIGDEAFADAANPMILFDTQSVALVADTSISAGFEEFFQETATSRFAFEGQVPTLMDEELTLLRGRDDFLAPGVKRRPAYNRFYWNYTRGIDAGEVLYALNYNIRERQESQADGKVDAVDAQRQYPQGHGDAYGHYLTALKNYYGLLRNPHFSWAPRIEAVNILGVPVTVDYLDERKFAQAAVSLGRTAGQILALERRANYDEDATGGWEALRDGRANLLTGTTRHWGVDEWAARGAQGGYLHWVAANALLPEEDSVHEGIQKIDRETVVELEELAVQAEGFQRHADEAGLRVNPLGLTANSLLFDISPGELAAGKTHYEQVRERAVDSLQNAHAVFDRARESTQLLRGLENQSEEFATAVYDEERAFNGKLIDIYGKPYAGDIGPGKTYAQGYSGPDLFRFMYIDKPYHFEDPAADAPVTFSLLIPGETYNQTRVYDPASPSVIGATFPTPGEVELNYVLRPNRLAQFAAAGSGQRASTGKLQSALLELTVARTNLGAALTDHQRLRMDYERQLQLFKMAVTSHASTRSEFDSARDKIENIQKSIARLKASGEAAAAAADVINFGVTGSTESLAKVVGFSNDPSSVTRGVVYGLGLTGYAAAKISSAGSKGGADNKEPQVSVRQFNFQKKLEEIGFGQERAQLVFSLEQAFDTQYLHQTNVDLALKDFVAAQSSYQTLVNDGLSIQSAREIFRKRAAAIAQGYRTRDVAFRTFRTEALEQYQGLLEVASRYSYLSAKAYDYETGLLGSEAGQGYLNKIVRSRSLGLLDANGQPELAGSSTGDEGLSGLMVRLDGDWSVVRSRLGFNNPDTYGTTFSLRREHFRVPSGGPGSQAWQQKLQAAYVPDLRADPDIAAHALQIEGSAAPVPGLVLEFDTMVQDGLNFFGERLMAADHTFSTTSFATKVHSVGVVFPGYLGMDPCLVCPITGPGPVTSDEPDALSATPYLYLIPVGADIMRTPPLGDGSLLRAWQVHDHALPLPYNLGANGASEAQYWTGADSLSEPFFQPRKHQAFRAVDNPEFFFSSHPEDFTNSRLVGRSVWNTKWKLVIPGQALLADPVEGIDKFIRTVDDVQIYLKTYSYSGN